MTYIPAESIMSADDRVLTDPNLATTITRMATARWIMSKKP